MVSQQSENDNEKYPNIQVLNNNHKNTMSWIYNSIVEGGEVNIFGIIQTKWILTEILLFLYYYTC